jgi:hypothetical protein
MLKSIQTQIINHMETQENNAGKELIATYMGIKDLGYNYKGELVGVEYDGFKKIHVGPLKYDSSWEDLMPVVEKLESEHVVVTIWETKCSITDHAIGTSGIKDFTSCAGGTTKIGVVFSSIVLYLQTKNI